MTTYTIEQRCDSKLIVDLFFNKILQKNEIDHIAQALQDVFEAQVIFDITTMGRFPVFTFYLGGPYMAKDGFKKFEDKLQKFLSSNEHTQP